MDLVQLFSPDHGPGTAGSMGRGAIDTTTLTLLAAKSVTAKASPPGVLWFSAMSRNRAYFGSKDCID